MGDLKTFRSYGARAYRRHPNYYSMLSKRLDVIWSQNEQIIAKLKDVEELLNKFAESLAKEEKNS